MIPRTRTFRPRSLRFIEADETPGAGTTTEPAPEAPAETPAETPAEEPAGGKPAEGERSPSVDGLPDWAQAEMRRLRSESAARRVKERELQEKLDAAKSPEEFEAVVGELRAENEKLARDSTLDKLTTSLGLNDVALELLADVPTDQLEQRAKKLAALAGAGAVEREPSGDHPDAGNDKFDPVAAAKAERARRR